MNGIYELLGAAGIAALILGLNWYALYAERPRAAHRYRLKIDTRTL